MRHLVVTIGKVLLSPLRLLLSIRRSMTASSVTLLLIGIISLNIVWGYPWMGLFAASLTMLVAGWVISRVMRPNLALDFSLPNSVPVDQPLPVTIHLRNRSRLPAMDLMVAVINDKAGRRARPSQAIRSVDGRQSVSLIRPDGRRDVVVSLIGSRRGIHDLPAISVESMFPFHLFRSTRRLRAVTQIAITPRLMTGDDDPLAKALLDTLGGWSYRLLAGDALDYTGSREYQVGMPVRRWDFASWARLGRPIVREFQSPSIQSVSIIVDTGGLENDADALERLLSLAATAVNDLSRKQVRAALYVASEPVASYAPSRHPQSTTETEPMLIQLAAAKVVDRDTADKRIREVLDHVGQSPALLLSTRAALDSDQPIGANVTMIRIDAAQPKRVPATRGRKPAHA